MEFECQCQTLIKMGDLWIQLVVIGKFLVLIILNGCYAMFSVTHKVTVRMSKYLRRPDPLHLGHLTLPSPPQRPQVLHPQPPGRTKILVFVASTQHERRRKSDNRKADTSVLSYPYRMGAPAFNVVKCQVTTFLNVKEWNIEKRP